MDADRRIRLQQCKKVLRAFDSLSEDELIPLPESPSTEDSSTPEPVTSAESFAPVDPGDSILSWDSEPRSRSPSPEPLRLEDYRLKSPLPDLIIVKEPTVNKYDESDEFYERLVQIVKKYMKTDIIDVPADISPSNVSESEKDLNKSQQSVENGVHTKTTFQQDESRCREDHFKDTGMEIKDMSQQFESETNKDNEESRVAIEEMSRPNITGTIKTSQDISLNKATENRSENKVSEANLKPSKTDKRNIDYAESERIKLSENILQEQELPAEQTLGTPEATVQDKLDETVNFGKEYQREEATKVPKLDLSVRFGEEIYVSQHEAPSDSQININKEGANASSTRGHNASESTEISGITNENIEITHMIDNDEDPIDEENEDNNVINNNIKPTQTDINVIQSSCNASPCVDKVVYTANQREEIPSPIPNLEPHREEIYEDSSSTETTNESFPVAHVIRTIAQVHREPTMDDEMDTVQAEGTQDSGAKNTFERDRESGRVMSERDRSMAYSLMYEVDTPEKTSFLEEPEAQGSPREASPELVRAQVVTHRSSFDRPAHSYEDDADVSVPSFSHAYSSSAAERDKTLRKKKKCHKSTQTDIIFSTENEEQSRKRKRRSVRGTFIDEKRQRLNSEGSQGDTATENVEQGNEDFLQTVYYLRTCFCKESASLEKLDLIKNNKY